MFLTIPFEGRLRALGSLARTDVGLGKNGLGFVSATKRIGLAYLQAPETAEAPLRPVYPDRVAR
jgi:hypothetical protein